MKRRQPEWSKPFVGKCCSGIDDVAELVEVAYKLFLERQKSRRVNWINLLKNNRYKSVVFRFIEQLGNVLNDYGVVMKTKAEVIKICYDYFSALDEYHRGKGHNGFFFNQIASMYALEVYINWAEENFGSLERYFEIGLEKKEVRDKREEKMREESNDIRGEFERSVKINKSKIKGLLEIEF